VARARERTAAIVTDGAVAAGERPGTRWNGPKETLTSGGRVRRGKRSNRTRCCDITERRSARTDNAWKRITYGRRPGTVPYIETHRSVSCVRSFRRIRGRPRGHGKKKKRNAARLLLLLLLLFWKKRRRNYRRIVRRHSPVYYRCCYYYAIGNATSSWPPPPRVPETNRRVGKNELVQQVTVVAYNI